MRILITGASGFVGPYAVKALRSICPEAIIVGASREISFQPHFDEMIALDIGDFHSVQMAIGRVKPTHILHLAAIAAPRRAASDVDLAWQVNVFGTINIADAVLAVSPNCVLANVGSGLVYGESARSGIPLDETALPCPIDNYGLTKIAADLAIGAMTHKGLRALRLRPFNHTGPGQGEEYVIPAFAMQIAKIEAGVIDPVLRVGNLEAERDFLDVRDVADAYALALCGAQSIPSGTIFNLASGNARRIGEILDILLSFSKVPIKVEQDEARMRTSDIPRIVGDATKARDILSWKPQHDFEFTLKNILNDCRRRVRQ